MIRHRAIQELRDIEGEYHASRFALPDVLRRSLDNPTLLRASGLDFADLRRAVKHLEVTYIIRLFAYFESASRELWNTMRPTDPPAKDLLDGLAARCAMPSDLLADAHDVREYRNVVVHEGETTVRFEFAETRSRLAKFMSHYPPQW